MAVAADAMPVAPRVEPSLEEVRELARAHTLIPLRHTFVDDCETPISAFLKLRGEGPAFLLESADRGRVGRWMWVAVFTASTPRSMPSLNSLRTSAKTLQACIGASRSTIASKCTVACPCH